LARAGAGPFAEIEIGSWRLILHAGNPHQCQALLGAYREDTVQLFRRILRPGDTYVEVGAEVGCLAAQASALIAPGGRMLLFEPDPRVFARLMRHAHSAPAAQSPKTILYKRACTDKDASLTLWLGGEEGQSRILAECEGGISIPTDVPTAPGESTEPDITPPLPGTGVSRTPPNAPKRAALPVLPAALGASAYVRGLALDQALADRGIERIRLMVLDAQGHEICALRGLRRALSEQLVDYFIVTKSTPLLENSGYTPAHLHAVFAAHGYVGIMETGEMLTPRNLLHSQCANILYALHEDRLCDALGDRAPSPAPSPSQAMSASRAAAETVPEWGIGHETANWEPFAHQQVEAFWEQVLNPHHPAIEANRIITRARRGRVREAISDAQAFLRDHPEAFYLRGRLAEWLREAGQRGEALEQYRLYLEKNPHDAEARRRLEELERRR